MSGTPLRHTDVNSIESRWSLSKLVVTADEWRADSGTPVEGATRVLAAAVIRNPWVGTDVETDLQSAVTEISPRLAKLLTDRIIQHIGSADRVVAFGKGAIIGTSGELEHGAALIHTPYFANLVRGFLAGDAVIAYADDRGDAGATLTVPLGRKNAGPTRDYFQTLVARIPDAPRPDEIVVIAGASTGTRPFPRSGDRTTDPRVIASDLQGVFL